MEENNKNNSTAMNIASLVLGIISIASSLFWYISLVTGILAIVFGAKAIKRSGKTLGKSGLTLRNNWRISLCFYIYYYGYDFITKYVKKTN